MAEYIEKQEATKFIDSCLLREEKLQSVEKETLLAVKRWIDDIPPADVRPVRRGQWLKSPECPEEYDICSVCGLNDKHRSRGNAEHPAVESIPPFCKWCGADMRGGDTDGDTKD